MSAHKPRYTFVGWLPCGHANLFIADPATVFEQISTTPDQRLEEWESLCEALSYYIAYGRVEIVDHKRLQEIELVICECTGNPRKL